MPHINDGDPRAHLDAAERLAGADKLIELARSIATEGMGDAPACNACVSKMMLVAWGQLARQVVAGDHAGEMMDMVRDVKNFAGMAMTLVELLELRAAMLSAGPDGLASLIIDVLGLSGKAPGR